MLKISHTSSLIDYSNKDLEAQPSLDPEDISNERLNDPERDEDDESYPLINETNVGGPSCSLNVGSKSLRRQYRYR